MTGTTRKKGIVMEDMDCRVEKAHVQVSLTIDQVQSLFSAINTAGLLSAGRIRRLQPQEESLSAAIESLESASGLLQSEAGEWPLD